MKGNSYQMFTNYHVIGNLLTYHDILKVLYVQNRNFELEVVKVLRDTPPLTGTRTNQVFFSHPNFHIIHA